MQVANAPRLAHVTRTWTDVVEMQRFERVGRFDLERGDTVGVFRDFESALAAGRGAALIESTDPTRQPRPIFGVAQAGNGFALLRVIERWSPTTANPHNDAALPFELPGSRHEQVTVVDESLRALVGVSAWRDRDNGLHPFPGRV